MPEDALWKGLLPALPEGAPQDIAARQANARVAELLGLMPVPHVSPSWQWALRPLLAEAIRTRDRGELAALLDRAEAPDLAMMVLRDIAAEVPLDWAREWADAEPDDPHALLVGAAALVAEAATQRLDRAADELDDFERMSLDALAAWAEELCVRAAHLDPQSAVPWLLAQHALPVAATRDDVLEAARRWQALDETSFVGNVSLVSQLSELRAGYPDDTLALAVRLSRGMRRHHVVHGIVPVALVGRFVALAATGTADEARAELKQHRDLLLGAYRRSVGAPRWRPTWLDVSLRNHFAFCCYLADLDDEAWAEVVRLEGRVTATPWELLHADPVAAWEDARDWLARRWLRQDPRRILHPPRPADVAGPRLRG